MEIYQSKSDQPLLDWQWLEPSLRNITAIILKHLPSVPGKALDVGCGTGRVTFELGSCGFDVEGIDSDPRIINLAKKISANRGVQCNFRLVDFRDPKEVVPESYDLIVCSEVLEHIVDYERIHQNIFKSLKPGGRLILTVPYDPNKFSVLDKYNGHVRRFTYEQVLNDLKLYKQKKIIITGFPFYRLICRAYLLKLKLMGGQHSNENLWSSPLTRMIAQIIYPFCRLDNFFAFTRLGDALIAIADK